MENDLELEDRILTMLSTQYEGIYQIDIDNDSVLCIYNRGNKFKKDGNVELEQWVQRMVDRCHYEDRGRLLDLISVEAVKGFGSNDEFKNNFLSRSSAISLIYGSLGRKNDPKYTPELAFSQVDLPYISSSPNIQDHPPPDTSGDHPDIF